MTDFDMLLLNGIAHRRQTVEADGAPVELCGHCGSLWPCLAVFQYERHREEESAKHTPGATHLQVFSGFSWYWVTICDRCLRPYPCRGRLFGS